MCPSTENPASLVAGRASQTLILAGERAEDTKTAQHFQGSVIGIDPGIAGALAFVSRDGDLIDVADMPTLRDGSGGRAAVNAPLLAELLLDGAQLRSCANSCPRDPRKAL
jgi:hypothetical protein